MLFDRFNREVRQAATTGLILGGILVVPRVVDAQTGRISGRVADAATLEPLPSAQVFIPAANLGTLTDAQGRYELANVPVGPTEVQVQLIGYRAVSEAVTVQANQTATINFDLNATAVSLGELVVTATGEQRRRELGHAVSSIDAGELLAKTAAPDLAKLIQGNATGVQVARASGAVGNAVNIRIRGNTSINLDNMPLVYIDGARVNTDARDRGVGGADSDRFLDISPEDIASIEIVKGPAAATLYGTEAAAGVIRITTKRGGAGQARITVRSEYGLSWDPNEYPVRAWNPSIDLTVPGLTFADTTYYIDNLKGAANIPNAGLYYNPFRMGEQKSLSVSMRGGRDDFGYYTSFDWGDQEGVFPTNWRESYNVRGNFSFQPAEHLDVSLSNGFTSSTTAYNYNDGESWGYVGAVLLGEPEYSPIRMSDPNSGGEPIVTCPLGYELARASGEPLAEVTSDACTFDRAFIGSNNYARLGTMSNELQLERYIGSGTLRFTPRDDWMTRLTVGYDSYTERGFDMIPNAPLKVRDSDPTRSVDHVSDRTLTLEGTSTLTYNFTPDWRAETTVGAQYFHSVTEITEASGTNFPPGAGTVGNAASKSADEGFIEIKTLGFFVQEQLSYADRLFITPGIRFDDNSAFGSNLGSISYPRLSVSYVISEEQWFPNLFDDLRLRGAWGKSGKQPGPFDAVTLLAASSVTLPDGSNGTGFQPVRLGNADLQPETGVELELGFDASLLDGRLGVEFTYFDKETRDALVLRPVAPSTGFGGVWSNVGAVINQGIETAVDATLINTADATWDVRVGYMHLKSEVTELAAPIAIGGRGLQEHREGYPFGAYFMRPVTVNDAGEIVVADERVYAGKPTPSYEGSVASTLSLFDGRLTFYGLVGFIGGYKTVNYTEVYMCRTVFGTCAAKYVETPEGEPTRMARLKADPAANFQPYHFLYDASFAKVRTLSARYMLPDDWSTWFGAESASFALVGSNLFTFTDYPGTDPEINSQGRQNASQREFFSAGQTSQVSLGFTLSF